jgi:hypothetical protein
MKLLKCELCEKEHKVTPDFDSDSFWYLVTPQYCPLYAVFTQWGEKDALVRGWNKVQRAIRQVKK